MYGIGIVVQIPTERRSLLRELSKPMEALGRWDEQVDTASANREKECELAEANAENAPPLGEQPYHLHRDKLPSVLLAVCVKVLDGMTKREKSLFWFLGDTINCRERSFHLELGRGI